MSNPRRSRLWIALSSVAPLVVVLGSAWSGCSAGTDDGVFNNNAGGAGNGGGAGGLGGASGGGGDGGSLISLDGGNDGNLGDASCASQAAAAQLIPLDMVILLDRSGSMLGGSWTGATNAISTFVQDPGSAGMNAGIQFFPPMTGGDCDVNNYKDLPVDVGPIGPGGTATPLIINSMGGLGPSGGTPMGAAIEGVLFHATALQDANPDHKVIVVLATDGIPGGGCANDNVAAVAQFAASAYNYNGVQTFTIAITGANLTALNQIAAAGGTGQALDVTADITQFAAKMKEIQASALACELLIPEPPEGQTLDPDLVNVSYDPSDGGPTQSVPKADSASDCGAGPGWYYDDPVNPTKILFCPGTCTVVQNDPQAEVSVLFGCETVPN